MTTVYLALGANVGDAQAHIQHAIELLGEQLSDITCAPLYRSKAVGYTDQPDFMNTVISGQTKLSPEDLLDFVKQVEHQVGRIARFHWGPREIDIDIILHGDTVIESQRLTIPHPAFRERDFVLRPLCDLAPNLQDPVTKRTMDQLLTALPADQRSILVEI